MSCGVLELFVKEPLIDLDPREASCFDGSLALLAINLATICLTLLVQTVKEGDLVSTFAEAISLTHVVTVSFAEALTRNEGQLPLLSAFKMAFRCNVVVDVLVVSHHVSGSSIHVALRVRRGGLGVNVCCRVHLDMILTVNSRLSLVDVDH